MTSPNDSSGGGSNSGNTGDVRQTDPRNAAIDPNAAAQQSQVKADHDALEASARRVESSVPADVRDTPIQRSDASAGTVSGSGASSGGSTGDVRRADPGQAAVDPVDAARQDQVRADHDALQESARRVEASVSSDVRNTPVQHTDAATRASEDTTEATRNGDAARANADAARDSARRVEQSLPDAADRDRR